ncbi:hypothetical protein LCGC14_2000790 [marine sediment metagenome]|uniref:DZANK-type domain-containing protein n=1 Tax=marine sediment metagenome TaxID=412755 RepID=A0A0F9FR32_9ZZZZ
MFTTIKVSTFEGYCPNGHSPLPDLLTQSNHSVRFCFLCGALIEERQVSYDAAYCSTCNSPVSPTWNFCPYCGQGRQGVTPANITD